MYKILIAAGLGGTLPTLCRLGASYNANPTQPQPALGVYLALILFFVIGMAVAYGFQEPKIQKAFALGIAAPGIVTSILSGASPPQVEPPQASASGTAVQGQTGAKTSMLELLGIGEAHAQNSGSISGNSGPPAGTTPEKQLIVQPGDSSQTWTNSGPVELKFLGKDGTAINQLAVSLKDSSTVIVPAGATAVEASAAGKTTVTTLPSGGFTSAVLTLHVQASASNDFLWALGAPRSATVSAISGKVSEVKPLPAATPNAGSAPVSSTGPAGSGSHKQGSSACATNGGTAGRTGSKCTTPP